MLSDPATLQDFEKIFQKILEISVELAVLAFFIMLIVGGVRYITSGGDQKATESAQHTLTNAFLGLVVFASLFLLLNFIKEFTGVDVTIFNVPK